VVVALTATRRPSLGCTTSLARTFVVQWTTSFLLKPWQVDLDCQKDRPSLPSSNVVPRKHEPVAYHYNRPITGRQKIITQISSVFHKTPAGRVGSSRDRQSAMKSPARMLTVQRTRQVAAAVIESPRAYFGRRGQAAALPWVRTCSRHRSRHETPRETRHGGGVGWPA
jgi:hypothetical protein